MKWILCFKKDLFNIESYIILYQDNTKKSFCIQEIEAKIKVQKEIVTTFHKKNMNVYIFF
jgi:hypothetical protein